MLYYFGITPSDLLLLSFPSFLLISSPNWTINIQWQMTGNTYISPALLAYLASVWTGLRSSSSFPCTILSTSCCPPTPTSTHTLSVSPTHTHTLPAMTRLKLKQAVSLAPSASESEIRGIFSQSYEDRQWNEGIQLGNCVCVSVCVCFKTIFKTYWLHIQLL